MITADKLIKKLEWLIERSNKERLDYISSSKVKEYIKEHKQEEEMIMEDMYNESNKNGGNNEKNNMGSSIPVNNKLRL